MKRMKLLSATAVVLAMSCASATAQQTLKLGHAFESSEALHTEVVAAGEAIAERTDGRYEIQVYPSSQLGNNNDMDKGLTLGTVDIVLSNNAFAATAYPPIGITQLPYIFRDADHLLAFTKSDVYRDLNAAYEEETGHHIVATTYFGSRHAISRDPIETCADLENKKYRVVPIPAYAAVADVCESNATPITYAEVYLALQNGTVDVAENPLTAMEAMKFYEVAKNILLTGHIIDSVNTVIAKSVWQGMSEEDRAIVAEEFEAAAARTADAVKAREQELTAFFESEGLTVREADRAAFAEAARAKLSLDDFGFRQEDFDAIQAIE
ncbi:MAG: TRAP transporter substrate-binding protein DctP [Pseudomonadota bacterium]|nr:TRAP transporter substrate-binding protein DctP [Pseudomonadota bacterium]